MEMEHYQIAIYGAMTVVAMTVIQYFITSYFKRSEKLKEEKIESILTMLKEMNEEIKEMADKFSNHNTELALCKLRIEELTKRLDNHSKLITELNKSK